MAFNNINPALPNMSDVIRPWFLNITLQVVERTLEGVDWVESVTKTIKTKGVVQPPSAKELKIMPEGAWAWEWLTIHCLPDVQLEVNQYVKYDDKLYKIMNKKDWRKYGYVKYTLLEAYQAEKLSNG